MYTIFLSQNCSHKVKYLKFYEISHFSNIAPKCSVLVKDDTKDKRYFFEYLLIGSSGMRAVILFVVLLEASGWPLRETKRRAK